MRLTNTDSRKRRNLLLGLLALTLAGGLTTVALTQTGSEGSTGISVNGLSSNAIDGGASAILGGGPLNFLELSLTDEGRELLPYVTRCALGPQHEVTYMDAGIAHTVQGGLGIAPEWLDRSLDADEEELLTACLLAHVNAFGDTVPISLRSEELIEINNDEQWLFTVHEGAFFGSLENSEIYACSADDSDSALGMSSYRAARVCTDGHPDCLMESVGPCSDVCSDYDSLYGFSDCSVDGVTYGGVVNVFLLQDTVY